MDKENTVSVVSEQKATESTSFYSYRKVVKCLSDGISLYTDNIVQFTRLTVPVVAIVALVTAVLAAFADLGIGMVIAMAVWGMLSRVCYDSIAYAFVLKKCVVRKNKPTMAEVYNLAWRKSPRMLWASVFQWLVMVLSAALLIPVFLWTPESLVLMIVKTGVMFVLMLAQLVLYIPTELAVPSAVLERGRFFKDLFTGYKYGFKSWLRLFTLAVLVNIILYFAALLLGSPMLVLNMVDVASTVSLNMGDSVTLPVGLTVVRSIVVFVFVFIYFYICTAVRFAFVYFYASTKADMKEREANEIPLI